MGRVGLAIWVAAVGVGVVSGWAAFGADEPLRWLPDLLVGFALIGAGIHLRSRQSGPGSLLIATGFAWFAGNLWWVALFWHRGPLVHLLVAYPRQRPGTRTGLVAVAAGYAAALATPVWSSDAATIALAVALVALAAGRYLVSAGRLRRHRFMALAATSTLGAVLVAGAVARMTVPGGAAVVPALLGYEAALCGIAVGLAAGLRQPPPAAVTDLVVQLAEKRSGTLRDALATVLGDPTLQVGYWMPETRTFVDAEGHPIPVPAVAGDRSSTRIERDGQPFAVLVHDPAVLGEASLVDAVAAATRLTGANVTLQAEVRGQLSELGESRRRLVVAADEERQSLERRLHAGPERRLVGLRDTLRGALGDDSAARGPHVERATTQLEQALVELDELAHGLHPRELASGLAAALAGLAGRSPVPVRLSVTNERFPPEVEIAAYYTCAEALANVSKHAAASSVSIDVVVHSAGLRVVVADDGDGGADPSRGSGLRGLADRIEALGGRLAVDSAAGAGTRLAAEIPLGGQPR